MTDPVYLDYSQEELDDEYNQRTLVPNISPYMDRARKLTTAARERLNCRLDVAYGTHPNETLDVFCSGASAAPVAVFVHGGAWLRGSKDEAAFSATVWVNAGAVFAAANFSLRSEATLDEMIDQVRRAIVFMYDNAGEFGGDPESLYLMGHSSGAHLAALTVVTDWEKDFDRPADMIKGLTAVSGPYDLAPVRLSARNDYMHLDEDAVRRNSPATHIRDGLPPAIFGWGGKELAEFQRQGRDLADAWEGQGLPVQRIFMKDKNHFDMCEEFADPESPLVQATLRQMSLG